AEEPASEPSRLKEKVKVECEQRASDLAVESEDQAISVSDEEPNDWNMCSEAPRPGPMRPTKPEAEVPALFGVARANRKKPYLDHHWLGPQLIAFRSNSGDLLEKPLVISSLGKGQNRIVYSVSGDVVMKLTTDLAAHGNEHALSIMFKEMAAQV
ncbi:unnamed protein product, partial [Symbiodinium sp. CCMP2456]